MDSSSQSNGLAQRAGRYTLQPGGYRAFVPALLPPSPPIDITAEMQVLLSQADRGLGRLDGSVQTLPNADLFVAMYVRKEAVLSSQIEGTQSSLADLPVSVRLIREIHEELLRGGRGRNLARCSFSSAGSSRPAARPPRRPAGFSCCVNTIGP